MLSVAPILLLGFFLGMRHATDPDHVLAVSTIVGRERSIRFAAVVGSLWGIGHTVTLLVVGGVIVVFDIVVPPRLGMSMEVAVGFMLVLLGTISVTRALRGVEVGKDGAPLPKSTHRHGDYIHEHTHGRSADEHGHDEAQTPAARLDRRFGKLGLYRALRPIAIGTVHGLAGSAGIALLIVPTIRTAGWAIAYLLVFGIGTIAGMLLVTAVLALPFAYTAGRADRANRFLRIGAGVFSVAFGAVMIWRLGFVGGLFGAH